MVYPTLIAAVSDASQPRDRARIVGVYRFWRDFGFVVGALIAGFAADATSPKRRDRDRRRAHGCQRPRSSPRTTWQPRPSLRPAPVP